MSTSLHGCIHQQLSNARKLCQIYSAFGPITIRLKHRPTPLRTTRNIWISCSDHMLKCRWLNRGWRQRLAPGCCHCSLFRVAAQAYLLTAAVRGCQWLQHCSTAALQHCSTANISAQVVSSGSVHGQTCAQPHLGKTWNCYFSKSQRLSQQSTPFQLHCNWNIAGSQFQENPLSKISFLTTFQGLWPVQSTSKKYP